MKPLDVRDMYAMAALQGLLASDASSINADFADRTPCERGAAEILKQRISKTTIVAMLIADEMMKLREGEPK